MKSPSLVTGIALCALSNGALAQEVIPFDSERWSMNARNADQVEYLGRDSLFLFAGRASIQDVKFQNFVVEFEIAFSNKRGFPGVVWNIQDAGNHEHFYLRPHQSGNPDSYQYTPVFNGVSGWQLYAGEGFSGATDLLHDAWMPAKLEVWEGRARFSLRSKPIVFMEELKHEPRAGFVGLQVPNFAPAYFSNFRCSELKQDPFGDLPKKELVESRGWIRSWSVSQAFSAALLEQQPELDAELESDLEWERLESEATGLVNLARVQGLGKGNTCFARASLDSPDDQNVGLEFGFSDKVRVYLNGRLLYAGDNSYLSRDYRYLGTIGSFDRVYLPLQKGTNELLLAVTEGFGGWGVQARLNPIFEVLVH